jgi:aspartyl protease family protein
MWKAALLMLVVGVTVGALMPAPPPSDSNGSASTQPPPVIQQATATSSPPSSSSSGGTVTLPRRDDGHFYASAEVNGSTIEFMVDTGATVVSLSRADAERVGITVDPDLFEVVAEGASGPVMGIPVVLREVSLGDHRVADVPALVLADSRQSLLGQNVIGQFESVSIENDQMMLR